jgi:aspartate aminotransferase
MSAFESHPLAGRMEGLALSDIVQIKQRAAQLASEGRRIVDLSIGEPDFETPQHIQEAAVAAMARGETHYTATAGTPALRAAIARKLVRDNRREAAPGEIIVGVGAKQIIANALLATVEPGDEVIIPAPFWSNYADMVRFAGGQPVVVGCPMTGGFLLSPEQFEAAITPRTRWLMLNSPSNPTGACYTLDQLRALARIVERHPQLYVMEDAIYERLIYAGHSYHSILDASPALAGRTLWINGVSKAYAMTGWRIGYGVGPKWLIDAMAVVSAQTTSHPCSIAQAAAVAALDGDQDVVEQFRDAFERRRAIVCEGLSVVPGLDLIPPAGAFYAFVSVGGLLAAAAAGTGIETDRDLAEYILEAAGVAVVPGSSFGAPGHIRLSFAASDEALQFAVGQIAAAARSLTDQTFTNRMDA